MKKTLRIGVIGLGRLGYQHTMNVTRTMGARLAVVSDPFPAALERAVEDFGVTGYADYKEMLKDPAVDAVVIATPTQTHYDVLMEAHFCGKAHYLHRGRGRKNSEGRGRSRSVSPGWLYAPF